MLSRSSSRLLLLTCLLVLLVTSSFAQYRASLQGTVTDEQGAVVPGAKVTLTSKETNSIKTATTDGNGVYSIGALAPGLYTLAVEKQGFKQKRLTDVQITAEQTQGINVELGVGQASETVDVSAAVTPAIDTETAQISGTITAKDIQTLPSFGRDPFQLLRLSPGVFGDGALSSGGGSQSLPGTNMAAPGASDSIFKTENGAQIIANGTRQNSNSFQIDGVETNSLAWGGATVITPNEESVKEVKLIANNYSAEYGRNSGAQVLVVSQNGTNNYHGSFIFKVHRPGLNAYNKWDGPGGGHTRDNNRFNQWGGSVGGPIIKNKLFGFFSYETIRNSSTNTGTGWYETTQFLQNAATSGSIASQILSYPGEGVSALDTRNVTCGDAGLSATQCQAVSGGLDVGSPLTNGLGAQDPTFGAAGTPYGVGSGLDGVPDIMYVDTLNPTKLKNEQYNARVDFQPTSADLFAFSMYRVPVDNHNYNGPTRAANQWNHTALNFSWTALYTRTLSPTMINEARFGASGWNWDEVASNGQEPWGLPQSNIDSIGGAGVQFFGPPGPSIFNQITYNIRDTLTKVVNSHSLKFGGDIYLEHDEDQAAWGARPSYDFRNLWEFANDAPRHEHSYFDPVTGQPTAAKKLIRSSMWGFFVQDDWKVRPNLTVNLGLRWEYFSPITEVHGDISNVRLGSGSDALTNLVLKKGGNLFDTSKNNWGPQLGFAWSPKGIGSHDFNNRLVVRGGFGIGYNHLQEAITLNGRFNPPFLTELDLFGSNILYAVPSDVHQFTDWPSNPNAVQSFDPTTGLPTSGAPVTINAFPSFMPTPTTYRYSFDTQYDLGGNWVATIGYSGSQTRHYTRQNNLNWVYYPNLNPMVQNLQWYSNDANAHFNALNTEVQHRFSKHFEVDVQYRLSRTTDQGSQDYYTDQYPFDISYSNGPADFDATHNFKLWGVWTPTLFKNNNMLEKVLGGWTISGIYNAHSGFPWTPTYSNTGGNVVYPNSGYWTLRPAAYSGGAGTNYSQSNFAYGAGNFTKGALNYFTVPTFPATGTPPPPGVGRNTFRGPRYMNFDMTLAKSFGMPKMPILGENSKLEVKANFYNLFNVLNVTNLDTTISSDGTTSNPHFGKAWNGLAGRIVEMQARFSF